MQTIHTFGFMFWHDNCRLRAFFQDQNWNDLRRKIEKKLLLCWSLNQVLDVGLVLKTNFSSKIESKYVCEWESEGGAKEKERVWVACLCSKFLFHAIFLHTKSNEFSNRLIIEQTIVDWLIWQSVYLLLSICGVRFAQLAPN